MTENELILSSLLNVGRTDLYLSGVKLTAAQEERLANILRLRSDGVPLQYILGKAFFRDLELKVCEGVFIPRPETEILVGCALDILRGHRLSSVLDIGTGSGCIAVSLAVCFPCIFIDATDISSVSLRVASSNALASGVMTGLRFIDTDMFPVGKKYDMIVSNPPYIRSSDIDFLQKEVRNEPRAALDGGADGMDFYRRIIDGCAVSLNPAGFLLMEIGYGQRAEIDSMLCKSGLFDKIEVRNDYSNIERVVVCRRKADNKWIN